MKSSQTIARSLSKKRSHKKKHSSFSKKNIDRKLCTVFCWEGAVHEQLAQNYKKSDRIKEIILHGGEKQAISWSFPWVQVHQFKQLQLGKTEKPKKNSGFQRSLNEVCLKHVHEINVHLDLTFQQKTGHETEKSHISTWSSMYMQFLNKIRQRKFSLLSGLENHPKLTSIKGY